MVGDNYLGRPSVPLSRGVQVWFEGKFIEHARVLDAYANCFVRRNHSTKNVQPHTAAAPPRSSRMSLRDLHELRPPSRRTPADDSPSGKTANDNPCTGDQSNPKEPR